MPVRKVLNRGTNIIGKFPSLKMGRMVAYESLLELDFLYLLDYEANVAWFEEQPLKIEYEYNSKLCYYTPDFHVKFGHNDYLIECKPAKLAESEDNQRKFTAAEQWSKAQGWQFKLVTENQLRLGHYLENVKILTRYARHAFSSDVAKTVCIYLRVQPRSIRELGELLSPGSPYKVESDILCMAYHHQIVFELDEAHLSHDSLVYLGSAL